MCVLVDCVRDVIVVGDVVCDCRVVVGGVVVVAIVVVAQLLLWWLM